MFQLVRECNIRREIFLHNVLTLAVERSSLAGRCRRIISSISGTSGRLAFEELLFFDILTLSVSMSACRCLCDDDCEVSFRCPRAKLPVLLLRFLCSVFFESQHCFYISCVFPQCKTLVINIFSALNLTQGLSLNVQLCESSVHFFLVFQ